MPPFRRRTVRTKPRLRIRRNTKSAYQYVDPVTLKPLGSQARVTKSAQAQLLALPKELFLPENVGRVTTLVLLRLRAGTVRARDHHRSLGIFGSNEAAEVRLGDTRGQW